MVYLMGVHVSGPYYIYDKVISKILSQETKILVLSITQHYIEVHDRVGPQDNDTHSPPPHTHTQRQESELILKTKYKLNLTGNNRYFFHTVKILKGVHRFGFQ
jgi:hypothetical protein